MLFVTGDTHIPVDIKKLNTANFPQQKEMSRDDYVVVLGDFGLLWHENATYRHWLDLLTRKNFTILWLDGNHENHDWIARLPEKEWNGGRVHVVAENILHLMRGQIFSISGKKFFVCGGAASVDKEQRTVGISWWPQEDISWAESEEALNNLEKVSYGVDYIFTHTCPASLAQPMFGERPVPDSTASFLDVVAENVPGAEWFFGHWHYDIDYVRYHCLYQRVIRVL